MEVRARKVATSGAVRLRERTQDCVRADPMGPWWSQGVVDLIAKVLAQILVGARAQLKLCVGGGDARWWRQNQVPFDNNWAY